MAKGLKRQLKGLSSSVESALGVKRRSRIAAVRAKPVTTAVVAFLALVSVAQLLRVLFHVRVVAGSTVIPLWASAVACVVLAVLALLLWRERM
jgi:uncharacterized membrane protein